MARHRRRTFVLLAASFIGIVNLSDYLPTWLTAVIALTWIFGILIPISFAVGPLGRWIGKELNDAAVEHASAEREQREP